MPESLDGRKAAITGASSGIGGSSASTAEKVREQIGELVQAEDIANAILYAVSQPEHVSLNEVLVRPTAQSR